MGAPPKADWREERRKRAWALKQEGWPQKDIAAALGVSEGAVSQWLRRAREGGGVGALTRRPPPGMTPRLSAEQRAQLPALLARGAPAYGFAGEVWTADRVAVVRFLRVLLRKLSGKVLLIWDGSPIHHGQVVKEFLSAGAAKRLQLEQLPGYAPDLNPDEGIWNYLKRVELGNVCATNLADLRHRLRRAAVRVRHKPDVIRACSRQCGYLL